MSPRSKILSINEINQKLKRLAWQVYEKNSTEKEIIVVGISERGLILAKQLVCRIQEISNIKAKIYYQEFDLLNIIDLAGCCMYGNEIHISYYPMTDVKFHLIANAYAEKFPGLIERSDKLRTMIDYTFNNYTKSRT